MNASRRRSIGRTNNPLAALWAITTFAVVPICAHGQTIPQPAGLAPIGNVTAREPHVPSTMRGNQSRPAPAAPSFRVNSSRVLRYAIMGALTGTALAMGYYAVSEKGQRGGECRPLDCALPYLTVSGTLAGLFLGRELEGQRIALAPRAGGALRFASVDAALLATPIAIDVRDTLIAVVSDSGVQLLSAASPNVVPRALRRRAAGLGSLRDIAIVPAREIVAIGTATGLWEAPLVTGPATRVFDGAVTALAASDSAGLSASGRWVRVRRGLLAARSTDSLDLRSPISAAIWDAASSSWWVATDSALTQLLETPTGLQTALSLPLPGETRRIALNAQWIAVASGTEGIIAWPREQLRSGGVISPVRLRDEPRFAYDIALVGDTAFVAGGVDGLFRVELSPAPRIVGSSRQFEYATTVRVENGVLWVGDRARKAVIRVDRN